MTGENLTAIRSALEQCSVEDRKVIFDQLRIEFPIHELERKLNAPAEVILEAIARASDLTLRGIRGIIAEAFFKKEVVEPLTDDGWSDQTPPGDHPYDFLLGDIQGVASIQVKMQRLEAQQPKYWRNSNGALYVVETQRTRTGRSTDGVATRPYRFGEFDLLAVCLHPSTGNWGDFRYTVARWLLPRVNEPNLIHVYQPVAKECNEDWTDNLLTAIAWFRSDLNKTIACPEIVAKNQPKTTQRTTSKMKRRKKV